MCFLIWDIGRTAKQNFIMIKARNEEFWIKYVF